MARESCMSDDHQDILHILLPSSDGEKWCIYRRGWAALFPKDHLLGGTRSLWDCLLLKCLLTRHIFGSSPKRPGPRLWCLIHFLDTPQVANSELKCVIQYYMSGQLRKDVNCKWKLGGREAEAESSLSPGNIHQPSRCWASSSSAVICEKWAGATSPLNPTAQTLAPHQNP